MRENDGKIMSVSVYLCEKAREAVRFCYFVNHLALDGGDKLVARLVEMNREYPLEILQPFTFDDLAQTDYRKIQKLLREVDASTLSTALQNAKDEVKEHIFNNMSRRASAMCQRPV
jgi:flagellar motor switch protein FliG